MGVLSNKMHEAMAQGLAQGMKPFDAYKAAGYTGTELNNAYQIMKHPDVKRRKEELIKEKTEREESMSRARSSLRDEPNKVLTRNDLQQELLTNLELARHVENPAAANKSIELLGQLSNLLGRNQKEPEPDEPELPSQTSGSDFDAGAISAEDINSAFTSFDFGSGDVSSGEQEAIEDDG